ncbi:transglutaminase domain-containing protein [Psychroserpens mesophilus]|uniref:transglutaminase domain-containing protein n=1 Tax=Psychroserpens mesophilus TaxID=325473 RepID=UPI003D6460FD
MKQIFTIFIFLSIVLSFNAQDFKFGKVSKEELNQNQHHLDSTANAAILYKNESIYFYYSDEQGFMQHRTIHKRIKIYNKEGYDWATDKIFLYKGGSGNDEKLISVKGYTFNIENGKLSKEKLKKDGIFEEEASDFMDINTITMPNIQDGCIIELTYKIVSPFLAIDDVFFQYEIPIDKFDFKIATPEYYVYNKKVNPKAFYYPKLIETTGSNSGSYVQTSSTTQFEGHGSKNYSKGSFEYRENIISANETDIPALKQEAFAGNMNNYLAKMSMELSAILNANGGVEKSFSSSWEKVSKSIYDESDFGNQLNRSGFFKDDVEPLVASLDDDFQKAFVLQSYVKSKVKWNGLNGFRAQKGTRSAYKEGEGNVADINLLLIAMLRSQGINANPVLVSTRNNGIPVFPTRKGFNYVICLVESKDSYALYDATELYSMPNTLPQCVLNWQGRVIKDDGVSGWISLTPSGKATESTSLNVKIKTDFTIEGNVRKNIEDHLALVYRKNTSNLSEDAHIKQLERNKGDIEISNIDYKNSFDITQPIRLSYDYILNDGIDEIGGNLYFSPMFFMATKESPFKLEERKYPIDFIFPFEDKYLINIMIPDGYQVESLPESGIYEFKNNDAKFTYMIKENGKYLQLAVSLDLNTSFINSVDYKGFKDFFEKIVEKQSEQIVLKKV